MKLVRDGKVAVLVSPGFGAGWSTWADENQKEKALFSSVLALAVEKGRSYAQMEKLCKRVFDKYFYVGGARDLEVVWLPVGTRFRIDEYDGSETLVVLDPEEYYVA